MTSTSSNQERERASRDFAQPIGGQDAGSAANRTAHYWSNDGTEGDGGSFERNREQGKETSTETIQLRHEISSWHHLGAKAWGLVKCLDNKSAKTLSETVGLLGQGMFSMNIRVSGLSKQKQTQTLTGRLQTLRLTVFILRR